MSAFGKARHPRRRKSATGSRSQTTVRTDLCSELNFWLPAGSQFLTVPRRGNRKLFASSCVKVCLLCAAVCDACAAECGKHEPEHCQRCAEACRDCAQE